MTDINDNTDETDQGHKQGGGCGSGSGTPATPLTTAAEWIRVKQVVARYGIGRASLYRLIAAGSIRSASLRLPGQAKATRLICRASLEGFIDSHAEGGEA